LVGFLNEQTEVTLSKKEKEERARQNLIIEYKHMHDDNWQRGHGNWLVSTILVTGSLIVAFTVEIVER
jgi:hypothetical protein